MELKHGIASHDAFSDLFNALDPEGLLNVMLRMARDWAGTLGDIVAVDGKALRRSFEDAANRSPLHLVQAFATEARLTLGQVEVDGKSNEVPAMPVLLKMLDISDKLVTADAMHTQRETATAVPAKGGDYLLALKGNQGTLPCPRGRVFLTGMRTLPRAIAERNTDSSGSGPATATSSWWTSARASDSVEGDGCSRSQDGTHRSRHNAW